MASVEENKKITMTHTQEKGGERGSGRFALATRHDDEDDDIFPMNSLLIKKDF